jgi:hypothetical protein
MAYFKDFPKMAIAYVCVDLEISPFFFFDFF